MYPIQYFAGFGQKDFMALLYLPALGIILIGSIIVLILKRRGRPYSLAILATPLAALGWYLYDKLSLRNTDQSQELLLAGAILVVGIFILATTSLVPETNTAVNGMALLAATSAFCFFIAAIFKRNE
jgi:hypothetical protein